MKQQELQMLLKAYEQVSKELVSIPLNSAAWAECYMRKASIQELVLKAMLEKYSDERKAA
jgi:hypothetical protein